MVGVDKFCVLPLKIKNGRVSPESGILRIKKYGSLYFSINNGAVTIDNFSLSQGKLSHSYPFGKLVNDFPTEKLLTKNRININESNYPELNNSKSVIELEQNYRELIRDTLINSDPSRFLYPNEKKMIFRKIRNRLLTESKSDLVVEEELAIA